MRTNIVVKAAVVLLAVASAGQRAPAAGEAMPGSLRTILKPGTHEAVVGDLIQVRFKTRAVADGMQTLRTVLRGDAVEKVSVVTAPLDPTEQQLPGAPFYLVLFLRAERPGKSVVTITPLLNDGTEADPFQFAVSVRAGL